MWTFSLLLICTLIIPAFQAQERVAYPSSSGCPVPRLFNDCSPVGSSSFPSVSAKCKCTTCPNLQVNLLCSSQRNMWAVADDTYQACLDCGIQKANPSKCPTVMVDYREFKNCSLDGSGYEAERATCQCDTCPQLKVKLKCSLGSSGQYVWGIADNTLASCIVCGQTLELKNDSSTKSPSEKNSPMLASLNPGARPSHRNEAKIKIDYMHITLIIIIVVLVITVITLVVVVVYRHGKYSIKNQKDIGRGYNKVPQINTAVIECMTENDNYMSQPDINNRDKHGVRIL